MPAFTEYQVLNDKTWVKDKPYVFSVDIKNAGRYALYINLRYNEDYNFSNIWVRTNMQAPGEKPVSQRFNIPLFSPDGAPLEDALGDVYFRRFPAQRIEQKLLPFDATKPGTYTFTLNQEMRTDNLPGIERIGLQVRAMD